jgi:hypothetical protein
MPLIVSGIKQPQQETKHFWFVIRVPHGRPNIQEFKYNSEMAPLLLKSLS